MISANVTSRHFLQELPAPTNQDSAIVPLNLTPSSTDFGPFSDADTELLKFTPSQVFQDIQTENLKFTITFSELYPNLTYLDSGTELFKLTPDSDEHYCPEKVEFEGDLESKWSAEEESRWKASNQSRWQGDFLGAGEGFAC